MRSFADGYAEAIREAAQGVGDLGGEGGDLVEGEDPVLAGESVEGGESLGARSGTLRQERRMARADAGSTCTGSGSGAVETEMWKRAFSPEATSH